MLNQNIAEGDPFESLHWLNVLLEERRWDDLEVAAEAVCAALAGRSWAERIASVETSEYEEALYEAVRDVLRRAPPDVRAICYEFEPEDAWEGTLFACEEDWPQGTDDAEWACAWIGHVAGPSFEPFAQLYAERRRAGSEASAGITTFLLARTMACFGRALDGVDVGERRVCIAFHDAADNLRVRALGTPVPQQH